MNFKKRASTIPTTFKPVPPRDRLFFRLKEKAGMLFRNGGTNPSSPLQVGLLPSPGWGRRNYKFVSKVLLPVLFGRRQGSIRTPDFTLPVEGRGLRLTWIGHATFLLEIDGMNILIDPNWANWMALVKRARKPGVALADLPRIDLVLISHAHFDHLQIRALRKIACGQTILTPKRVGRLVSRLDFSRVEELDPWQEVNVGPLKITMTPAKHWGARVVHDVDRGFGGFLIESSHGRKVYHCGDSAYFGGFSEIGTHAGEIDVALLPIGAYEAMSGRAVHMSPEEAVKAFTDLGAKHLVPMHYGTFPLGAEPMHEPLERFQKAVRRQGVAKRSRVMVEGCPVLF